MKNAWKWIFFLVKLPVLMGIFKAFFLSYNKFLQISHNSSFQRMKWHRNRVLVNCAAIFISFTLLLISSTQCFHLFLKSLMIKINWLYIFNMITPRVWKRTYVSSSYLILCFYYLIKDFISNWKCSAQEAAPWKEPHRGLFLPLQISLLNKTLTLIVSKFIISLKDILGLTSGWTDLWHSLS